MPYSVSCNQDDGANDEGEGYDGGGKDLAWYLSYIGEETIDEE